MKLCLKQVAFTPVVLVCESIHAHMKNMLVKKDITVSVLIDDEPDHIDALMGNFVQMQNAQYQVYIISVMQARGLDFPSSAAIESNGGNYLLLSVVPTTYLAFH